jgi:hypothetical protein
MKNLMFFLLLVTAFSTQSFSQQCKRKVIDCRGICGRMTDLDGDSICDFSPRSVKSEITTADQSINPVVENSQTDVVANIQTETRNNNLQSTDPVHKELAQNNIQSKTSSKTDSKNTKCEACSEGCNKKSDTIIAATVPVKVQTVAVKEEESLLDAQVYPLIELSALTFGLYFITWLLAKLKIFKTSVHRKIWNVVLFFTFLMSGILGLVLVVQLNYNILNDWYMSFLELHVDFGIAMGIISIFHILWHTKYFLTIFKKPKKR